VEEYEVKGHPKQRWFCDNKISHATQSGCFRILSGRQHCSFYISGKCNRTTKKLVK